MDKPDAKIANVAGDSLLGNRVPLSGSDRDRLEQIFGDLESYLEAIRHYAYGIDTRPLEVDGIDCLPVIEALAEQGKLLAREASELIAGDSPDR